MATASPPQANNPLEDELDEIHLQDNWETDSSSSEMSVDLSSAAKEDPIVPSSFVLPNSTPSPFKDDLSIDVDEGDPSMGVEEDDPPPTSDSVIPSSSCVYGSESTYPGSLGTSANSLILIDPTFPRINTRFLPVKIWVCSEQGGKRHHLRFVQ